MAAGLRRSQRYDDRPWGYRRFTWRVNCRAAVLPAIEAESMHGRRHQASPRILLSALHAMMFSPTVPEYLRGDKGTRVRDDVIFHGPNGFGRCSHSRFSA